MHAIASVALALVTVLLNTGPLKVGDTAPDFQLPAATKDSILAGGVRLADVLGKNLVILAFYPADWSGGCTKEMCTFRDDFGALGQLEATVFGISGDYVHSHREWASHLNLPFTLLSDHAHDVAKQYGSYNEKTGYNFRTVFVVDRRGRIGYIDRAYQAGSAESFGNLTSAVRAIREAR
jgi:peroxiredoxin